MKYIILIEKGAKNYSAYVPDLPGCVAAAKTKEKVIKLIRESIIEHIRLLKQLNEKIPESSTESEILEIAI
jgi:predicted RNase H-like HicB family nuclease